ncbi:MAG: hypothetical protein AMXMBFR81_20310 [Chthonomonas sp.]
MSRTIQTLHCKPTFSDLLRRERRYGPPSEDERVGRTVFEKDRDKLIYSPFLARLGGVAQIVSPSPETRAHNRLTHSLEVGQFARRLATLELRENEDVAASHSLDRNVAEFAGLAHDFGHPPYGHVGEEVLCDIMGELGYEGNAQSFRILGVLALPIADVAQPLGLNVTRAALASVLKYPFQGHSGKYSAYEDELDASAWNWISEGLPLGEPVRTAECEIMDYSDDVVYTTQDVSDFHRMGMINLNELDDWGRFSSYVEKLGEDPNGGVWRGIWKAYFREQVPSKHDGSTNSELQLCMWVNRILDALVFPNVPFPERPFQLTEFARGEVAGRACWRCAQRSQWAGSLITILKGLTRIEVINRHRELGVMHARARRRLRGLFDFIADTALPDKLRGGERFSYLFAPLDHVIRSSGSPLAERQTMRLVCDTVALMTDQQADMYFDLYCR